MPAPAPTLPPFWGSGRGRGRRDIRWHRRMSFLSRCTAALEWSLGEEVLEPGLTEKCTSPMWRASAWARACGGGEEEEKQDQRGSLGAAGSQIGHCSLQVKHSPAVL